MSDLVEPRKWDRWLPAFLRAKTAPGPAEPAADLRAPVGHGVTQGPPPPGPRQGTLVAVSIYLPFDADLAAMTAALVRLGYSNLEVREARHRATTSRVSASVRVPVLEASHEQVIASILAAVNIAPKLAPRIDVDTWPTY